MILIEDYIKKSRDERTTHLDLNTPCIERGGYSTMFRGLLAHTLDTNIPKGSKINLCHACNNDGCSNTKHLYWGTATENYADSKEAGSRDKTIWDYMVEKYGLEEAGRIQSQGNKAAAGGRGNKGKPKSKEHREKISNSLKKK